MTVSLPLTSRIPSWINPSRLIPHDVLSFISIVVLGILVLGEVLVWNEPVGALLVILGVLLAQRRLRWPRRAG